MSRALLVKAVCGGLCLWAFIIWAVMAVDGWLP